MLTRNDRYLVGVLIVLLLAPVHPAGPLRAQNAPPLEARIQEIINRPVFRHASFGIEFLSLDTGKVLYALNPQKLFTPASTTKLLTEGTALALLGPGYRFHTRVYRTGPVDQNGVLHGDLVLVGSGDPNLSQRIQPDGTLAFENDDHCYGGPAVPGDPLIVIKQLAAQVAARGVKQIGGRVLVDVSLFPEGPPELGTGTIISPVVINDNIVDVTASPGLALGAPVTLRISPATSYVQFVNRATTGPAGSEPDIEWSKDEAGPDGTHTVIVTGNMPLGKPPQNFPYAIPQPSRFAEITLANALQANGVTVTSDGGGARPDFQRLSASYTPANLVAEHTSPPLSEDVKITLKVSQNLHASLMPYILGAVVGHATVNIDQAGFNLEHNFLEKAGLDLTGASQSDGAGGSPAAFFTPDFVARYLAFVRHQNFFPQLFAGLPILGRDGTLVDTQTQSPAAGHVFAKTGTFDDYDMLNQNDMVTGKGLAGYFTTPGGRHIAFAIYANEVAVPGHGDLTEKIVGQALGEIAAAGYADLGPAEAQADPPAAGPAPVYDVLIKNGHIIDGTGNPWYAGDVAIENGRIAAIGKLAGAKARRVIDARGLVVAPGFIDMLGQSEWALLIDHRALSKLSQGITTEITGEGGSIAPQDALTLAPLEPFLDHYHLKVDWTTLGGYFKRLKATETPINLGTYVGAAQVREAVLGDVDRAPTPAELTRMEDLVARAMQQGALGISTALIYPPGSYAKTDELIALAKVAARYGGIYATHLRSEGATEIQALDEAFRIGREAHIPVEIFHMKVSGKSRWGSMPKIVAMIDAARASGLDVRADMYPYTAGNTSLASCLPPWVANGGPDKLLARLRDAGIRARIKAEMAQDHPDWENLYVDSGGASGVLISSVMNPKLDKFEGKTLAQVARMDGKAPLDAMMDLILADNAQTEALYFMAGEKDLEYGLKQPWTSIGLDAQETSLDGPLYEPHDHPRAWGSMPRFLGYYVRQKHLLTLENAIRKITSLPAQREHLAHRGLLEPGYDADITVFNPATIEDTATYLRPASLSTGVDYVFVNGELEYEKGRLTGVYAGRPLRGPGWVQP
ncbi:MAG: D-alanyl-D-alanine carboxypeptidase/D-alanyl-D-alanine endopeptidase [Terriglobia bacterium]